MSEDITRIAAAQYIEELDTRFEKIRAPYAPSYAMQWRVLGDGPPMVLVHGGHGSWLHWIANIEYLMRHFRLFIVDLPGFGDSELAPSLESIERLAEMVCSSLDVLLPGRPFVHVVAFSFGGLLSAQVCAMRGAVETLSLVGSIGSRTTRRPRAEMVSWRYLDEEGRDAALRHNLLAHMLFSESHLDAIGLEAYSRAVGATRSRTRGLSKDIFLDALLRDFESPVQFIWGEHDVTATPPEVSPSLFERQGRRRVVLANTGHWAQYENAPQVNSLIHEWAS